MGAKGIFGKFHKPVSHLDVLMAECPTIPSKSEAWGYMTPRIWALPVHFYLETPQPLWKAPLSLFHEQTAVNYWDGLRPDENTGCVPGNSQLGYSTKATLRYTHLTYRLCNENIKNPGMEASPFLSPCSQSGLCLPLIYLGKAFSFMEKAQEL